ncbi:Nucleosomal histone H3-Lys79 methylase [Recurvomyces mirabilis]|nr:Nucleosomal histone H3-Lys79 methylase [Recurvomyces mirabilis]
MFSSNAKKPVIKKKTVLVPLSKTPTLTPKPSNGTAAARPRDPNRFALSSTAASRLKRPSKTVSARALASARGVKRKSASPGNQFSDESDGDNDSSDIGASDSDASRKRIKSSRSSVSSLSGPRRDLVLPAAFGQDAKKLKLIHGADATSGRYQTKYKNAWAEVAKTCELQYPSKFPPERFQLKLPTTSDDYRPMEDIETTIETIVKYYLPCDFGAKYLEGEHSFQSRFNKAKAREDIREWLHVVEDFNAVVKPLVEDGTVERELRNQGSLHLNWIKRLLTQIYVRVVSPNVSELSKYEAGSDYVYGELLPRFVTDIFHQTGLNHEQIFVDLGSGVGNVALQAALEIGCESWGIEMLPGPSALAELQAKEFKARTQLWGLNVGSVNLLSGDMTNHSEIPPLLRCADVVLVNNQAFTPELNEKLRTLFLELKEGAKVVSLKPFVADGHKITERNLYSIENRFVQTKQMYYTDSVSWSWQGNGHWYIATKDRRPLDAFMRSRRRTSTE